MSDTELDNQIENIAVYARVSPENKIRIVKAWQRKFAHGYGIKIVLQGIMFATLSLIAFWLGEQATGQDAGGQTLAFMVLALSQVVQAFNMRSDHSLFKTGFFSNHKLNWAALISTLLVCLVLFTPVSTVFGLIPLTSDLYLKGLVLILIPLLVIEIMKAVSSFKN